MRGVGPLLTLVPARSPRTAQVVEHPAWREARERIIAIAEAGPSTVALLGEAGTGKTWLLRELTAALRARGREVTFVGQGDLPFQRRAGSAVLVDEASRIDGIRLAELAEQDVGLLILAGLPNFASRLELCEPPPTIISLRALDGPELRAFSREWLAGHGDERADVADGAIERVLARSEGIPRLAVQLLAASLSVAASSGQVWVGAEDVDEIADLRLCGIPPISPQAAIAVRPPAAPKATGPWLRHRRKFAGVIGAAIAASLLVFSVTKTIKRVETSFSDATVPAPSVAISAAEPATVPGLPPEPLPAAKAPLASAALPTEAAPVAPTPAQDSGPALPVLTSPELATVAAPSSSRPPAPALQDWLPTQYVHTRAGRGGAGLVLVARTSDTLQHLYTEVYRGVRPPPFAEVAAANQVPMRPGAILVFPAPVEGWNPR